MASKSAVMHVRIPSSVIGVAQLSAEPSGRVGQQLHDVQVAPLALITTLRRIVEKAKTEVPILGRVEHLREGGSVNDP
jgi:hypothetical protein